MDEWSIRPGDSIPLKIDQGIKISRKLLICMSPAYFESDWAMIEQFAIIYRDPINIHRRLIPLLIDDCTRPDIIAHLDYIDWRKCSGEDGEKYDKIFDSCAEGGSRREDKVPISLPEERLSSCTIEESNLKETITWLHISDTLFGDNRNGWDYSKKRDEFYNDLEKMITDPDHKLCPDILFYTGDIVYGNDFKRLDKNFEEQFEEANKFIENIVKIVNLVSPKFSTKNIFIVPGNHDLDKTIPIPEINTYLKDFKNDDMDLMDPCNCVNKLIINGEFFWEKSIERFRVYKQFLKSSGFDHLLEDPERLIYSQIMEIGTYKIGIAGLNSAWSSLGGHVDEKSNLWLGSYQIQSTYENLKGVTFSISLIHHPLDWFHRHESDLISRKIKDYFGFCLHGHYCKGKLVDKTDTNIEIASGAYYKFVGPREHHYNFVKIDPYHRKAIIFLRRFDETNKKWVSSPINPNGNEMGTEDYYGRDLNWIDFNK